MHFRSCALPLSLVGALAAAYPHAATAAVPALDHIIVVVMENKDWSLVRQHLSGARLALLRREPRPRARGGGEDLATDIASNALPNLAYVIPNNCNNMHNCGCAVTVGDTWLSNNVPAMIDAVGSDGVVILTWDEDSGTLGNNNHIMTVFNGQRVKCGYPSTMPVNHDNVLRTICDALGVAPMGYAATDPPITDIWLEGELDVPTAGGRRHLLPQGPRWRTGAAAEGRSPALNAAKAPRHVGPGPRPGRFAGAAERRLAEQGVGGVDPGGAIRCAIRFLHRPADDRGARKARPRNQAVPLSLGEWRARSLPGAGRAAEGAQQQEHGGSECLSHGRLSHRWIACGPRSERLSAVRAPS